jgi:uncharacterized protein (TIRG00374 family)
LKRFWAAFLLSMVVLVSTGRLSPWKYGVAALLIALLLWATGYAVYLYRHRAKMRRRVTMIADFVNLVTRRRHIQPEHIDAWLDSLFTGMRRMSTRAGAKRTALLYSCAFWFFDMLCLYFVFLAFGYRIGMPALVIGYAVGYAVGTLAPTPGGLGAIETILITMFVSFGVPPAEAVAVVLVYRLINFWLPIVPGLASYVAIR